MGYFKAWWDARGIEWPGEERPPPPPAPPPRGPGLFSRLILRWREARAHRLRLEVEDICRRIEVDHAQMMDFTVTLAELAEDITAFHGHPLKMREVDRRELAKDLLEKAKGLYQRTPGSAHGHAMFAAFLEATTLPGEDAALVRHIALKQVKAAVEFCDRARSR